jgi:hypothetical protein
MLRFPETQIKVKQGKTKQLNCQVPNPYVCAIVPQTGLRDGIFSYQKFPIGDVLEGLGMENVGIIICICSFGMFFWFMYFCCHLVYFYKFWYVVPRKIWQPCPRNVFVLNRTLGFILRELFFTNAVKCAFQTWIQTLQSNKD